MQTVADRGAAAEPHAALIDEGHKTLAAVESSTPAQAMTHNSFTSVWDGASGIGSSLQMVSHAKVSTDSDSDLYSDMSSDHCSDQEHDLPSQTDTDPVYKGAPRCTGPEPIAGSEPDSEEEAEVPDTGYWVADELLGGRDSGKFAYATRILPFPKAELPTTASFRHAQWTHC
jgi:hypothetical protein